MNRYGLLDMLFVGPNDLAASMGYVAFDHASIPEVQQATERVLAAALAAGKYAGHFALSASAAAQRYSQGFHFVNCGADIVAVTAWMSTEMGHLHRLLAETKTEEAEKAEKAADSKKTTISSQKVDTGPKVNGTQVSVVAAKPEIYGS